MNTSALLGRFAHKQVSLVSSSTRSISPTPSTPSLFTFLKHWFFERFTPAGRWFFAATIVFFVTGSSSLELQFYIACLYACALWLIAWLCGWFCRPSAQLHVQHAARVCAGETLNVRAQLTAQRPVPCDQWRVLPLRLPRGLNCVPPEGVTVPQVLAREEMTVEIPIQCERRGVYSMEMWSVESDFPFGLLRSRRVSSCGISLMVYPRFAPLDSLQLPAHARAFDGIAIASQSGESFEFQGNREYRRGDRIRDINWRATARLQRPVVREWCEERWPRAAVLLDNSVSSGRDDDENDNFERAVSLCAAVCEYMSRERYVVELFAAGQHLLHLDAEHNATHLDAILETLSCLESESSLPFAGCEAALSWHIAHLQVAVCLVLNWDKARQNFVRHLQEHGVQIKVVVVCDQQFDLPDGIRHIDKARFHAGVEAL